jgi:hypothetical protein
LLERLNKLLEAFKKFPEPFEKFPPGLRGLFWGLREISEERAASRLCPDKLPERRRNSGHRPDTTTFVPADLLAILAVLFEGACIYDEHLRVCLKNHEG